MKVQVKRATKLLFFCHQKKNKQKKQLKTRQALNEIFFNLQQKCAVGALTPYFKFNPLCSFVISFSKNISTPKMVHKCWSYDIVCSPIHYSFFLPLPCPYQVGTPLRLVICSPMENSSQNFPLQTNQKRPWYVAVPQF